MSETKSWDELYREALLELNESLLGHRIAVAEVAVRERLKQFKQNGKARERNHTAELHQLGDALYSLECLRRAYTGR